MLDRSGVYSFKVSLSKTLWRKISLSHKHTLGDLHNAIQEAFCLNIPINLFKKKYCFKVSNKY
jgi:hypothetical protein